MKLGIIGLGAVGSTIYKVLKLYHEDVRGYDILPERSKNTLDEILKCEAIFLCIPTSGMENGRLDVSNIIKNLSFLVQRKYQGLVIIKSTLPVGFFDTLPNYDLNIIFSPEFLYSWKAIQDFINPKFVVSSGDKATELIKILYWLPIERFYIVSHNTAIMIKLIINCFASMKISFINELEEICDSQGVDPFTVLEFLKLDGRMAEPYSQPRRGAYAGTCLPKDTREIITSFPDSVLIRAVDEVNEKVKSKVRKSNIE